MPTFIVAAQAQGELQIAPQAALSAPTIAASAMAPRQQREQLAPAVMAPSAQAASQAEATINRLAFDESVKRLGAIEPSDETYALAQYKRFFNERTLTPELGVQVGLKIAELRLQMGDSQGALQTCQVIGAKYADEPTAALFALEKARVLMGQKQLAEASQSVNEAMPSLVALGPSRYVEISDLLLQLVQANLDSGETEDKERAKALCVDVEEIYLRWTKKDAVDHLWQRFEALQTKYEEAGDDKRAEELLPKVGDALLKMPIETGYVEGAVLSVEAARWSAQQGQEEQAELFYTRVPQFGDQWHTILAGYEQSAIEMQKGNFAQARQILLQPAFSASPDIRLATSSAIANSYYRDGDLTEASKIYTQIVGQAQTIQGSSDDRDEATVRANAAKERLRLIEQWKQTPLVCEPAQFFVRASLLQGEPVTRWLYVSSFRDIPLKVESSSPFITVKEGQKQWEDDEQLQYNQEFEVTVAAEAGQLTASELTITSARFPNFHVQVPIQLTLPKGGDQIETSPKKTP